MCVDGVSSRVRINKLLSDPFPVLNYQKQGDALSQVPFNFALEHEQEGHELNGLHHCIRKRCVNYTCHLA